MFADKGNFTLNRVAITKKKKKERKIPKQNTASVGEDVEKLEPLGTTGGNVSGVATVENSMVVPQKIKHRITR